MSTDKQKENREKWLVALEQSRYPQTTGFLHRTDGDSPGYCCLGVACVVLDIPESNDCRGITFFYGSSMFLPPRAMEELGLGVNDPFVLYQGDHISLSELNDSVGLTHPEIAAVIRSQGPDWDGGIQ